MLLKGSCRNNIKLEYNLEQCYLALTDQLDWADPEGDRCPYDLSKPLPLQGNKERLQGQREIRGQGNSYTGRRQLLNR
ncbi:hypothetical protein Tco_0025228 [Tanacetum coccineum]